MITKRARRILSLTAAAYGSYLLFGAFGLPWLIKEKWAPLASEELGRDISLRNAAFNPFTLQLRLEGLRVADDWQGVLFEAGEIKANGQIASLFLFEAVAKEFSLTDARLNVAIDERGAFNFGRLLELASAAPEADAKPAANPIGFRLGLLALKNVSLSFVDRSKAKPFEETLGPVALEIRGLRMEKGMLSPHALVAKIGDATEIEWNGQVGLNPIASKGSLKVTDLQIRKGESYWTDFAEVEAEALVSLEANYSVELSEAGLQASSSRFVATATALSAGLANSDALAFRLPSGKIEGRFDLATQSVYLSAVEAEGIEIVATRAADGSIVLPVVKSASEPVSEDSEEPSKPWSLLGSGLAIGVRSVEFRDLANPVPATTRVEAIKIESSEYSYGMAGRVSKISASGAFAKGGTFSVSGAFDTNQLSGKVDGALDGLNLAAWQEYIEPLAKVDLRSASLNGAAKATLDANGEIAAEVSGELTGLSVALKGQEEPSIELASGKLESLKYANGAVSVGSVRVDGFQLTAEMREEGVDLLAALPQSEAVPVAAVEPSANSLPFELGTFAVTNSRIRLVDKAFAESFESNVSDIELTVSGISSSLEKAADLSLDASLDSGSKLSVKGKLVPLDLEKDSSLTYKLAGYDLTATAGYWRKFLGRDLAKGQFAFEGKATVKDAALDSSSGVRIDGIELGEKVASPDSLGLPVGLAVALLRDREGRIEIKDIEVKESLDNPEIGTGKIIGQAIGMVFRNILAKAATSPFALLSGLGGGKKNIDTLPFDAGSVALSDEAKENLLAMADILTSRPLLKVEISAVTNTAAEIAALRRPLMLRLLESPNLVAEGWTGLDPIALLRAYDEDWFKVLVAKEYQTIMAARAPAAVAAPVEDESESEPAEKRRGFIGRVFGVFDRSPKVPTDLAVSEPAPEPVPAPAPIPAASFAEMLAEVEKAHSAWAPPGAWADRVVEVRRSSVRSYLIDGKGIEPERVYIVNTAGEESAKAEGPSEVKLKPSA